MRCQNIHKLIYLNRPGELSDRQEKKLHAHLDNCPDCRKEYQCALQSGEVVSSFRTVQPALDDPNPMMDRVMNMISQYEPVAFHSRVKKRTQWSRALIGAAAMLLFAFVLHEMTVYHRISRLEAQMAMQSEMRKVEQPVRHVNLATLQNWIQEQPRKSPLTRFDVPEGTITIDADEYQILIHEIRQTRLMNELLLEMLGDDSTAWRQVRFEDGLNPAELRQIKRIQKRLKTTGRLPVEVKR